MLEKNPTNKTIPKKYNLFFEPDLNNFKFNGKVEIEIEVPNPTNKITLKASELKIKKIQISHNNETVTPKHSLNNRQESLTLTLPNKISNSAIIKIDFQGTLNDKLYGFYRSKYLDKNKKEKYLATTQFEAPYARRAFPCFDEPNKKATFSVTLKISKNLEAISNMPIIKQTTENDKKTIKFQDTPLMSTYLLYMGVGEFEFIESKLNNTQIRIATLPGKSNQGTLALDLTKKFLKYFQDYSKIPYPLPKLDMIAIPDFAAGAMENWGAITFREILLLFNPKTTSTRVKKRIAEVIAHELWHQWSGNLVTMDWWNDLWLNESFATYMAYKAVDHYFPEWKMWEDFINGQTAGAHSLDTLKTTHPIEVPVNSPNEIEEIFDEISYGKGGSVLRMIESYLSPETFQKGIQNYLSEYKYKNAKAQDLWNHLSKVSDAPIKEIMESWIKQPGFPLIDAKQEKNNLILTQKRFNSKEKTLWKIPLVIKTNNSVIKTLLTNKSQTLPLPKNTEWFKLNNEKEGFYRVKYSSENLKKLQNLIQKDKLSPINRGQIQEDLFNLTLIGEAPLTDYLDLIKFYNKETSPFVLENLFSNLYNINFIFSEEENWKNIWPKFKNHIKEPFLNNFQRLTWNPNKKESHDDSILRPLTISYLSFAEEKQIIEKGLEYFSKLLTQSDLIHPDIKGSIYTLAARVGNSQTYNSLIKIYSNTQSPEEKVKILSSLYKFNNLDVLKESLNFSLTKNVRIQDLRTIFGSINSNPLIRPIYFPWIKENWLKLEHFKRTHFVFMGLLESLITTYATKEKEKEIKQFLESKHTGYNKTKANAFEIMQINTNWLNKNKKDLEKYFS